MTIDEMLNKAKRFERGWQMRLARTLGENKKTVLRLQKDQLLSGIDSEGNTLTPSYTDDSFFKTQESAMKYVARKRKKEQRHMSMQHYKIFGTKNELTPNLIFASSEARSQFHRKLKVEVSKDTLRIYGTWSKSKNVENKYPKALGLTQRAFTVLWDSILHRDVIDYWHEL